MTGDATTGFKILDSIPIDCATICDELNVEDLEENSSLIGIFTRNIENTYVLDVVTSL